MYQPKVAIEGEKIVKRSNFDLLKKAGEQTVILGKSTLGAGTSLIEILSGRSLMKSRS